jgi:fucose 4-O-acetylase-like acetyltransferase
MGVPAISSPHHMTALKNPKNRDSFLDIAKGLAIILVVLGHVIQGSSEQFDDLLWFRVIYSFHMPLFVFLSGAVAAIAFRSDRIQDGLKTVFLNAKTKILKAVIRLLLPFIAWCVINQLAYHQSEDVISAIILAFRRPDTALWFLLAIFYCIVLSTIFDILFALIYQVSKGVKLQQVSDLLIDGRIQIVLIILIWWAIREHTPRGAGLGLMRPYFMYYIAGIGFYKYIYLKMPNWQYWLAWITFISLISFWSRTANDNIVGLAFLPSTVSYFYAGIVALSGSLVILSLARWLTVSHMQWAKKFLVLTGQLSLGIYAIHYFFLSYSPKVLAPLMISIGLAYVINRIPVVRTILLGEK